MAKVFCDRELSTENDNRDSTSTVIDHVFYSTEERKLFVLLLPREGEEEGVLAGYADVPVEIFEAMSILNDSRLHGDEGASVGSYWNRFVRGHFSGLESKEFEIVTQSDLDSEKPEPVFTQEQWDAIKVADAWNWGGVDMTPTKVLRFVVTFEVDIVVGSARRVFEGEATVFATDLDSALESFKSVAQAANYRNYTIKSVTQFFV